MGTSPIIENALRQLQGIFAAIESEGERVRDLDAQTAATQQRLDVLRKNEAMLTDSNNVLARQVAAAREKVADAEIEANKIVEAARRSADQIVTQANERAKRILADVRKSTEALISTASREVLDRSFGKGT